MKSSSWMRCGDAMRLCNAMRSDTVVYENFIIRRLWLDGERQWIIHNSHTQYAEL